MPRHVAAVKKASARRLMADMITAAAWVRTVLGERETAPADMIARARVLGMSEAVSSLTVRAMLLTAWGL